MEIPRDLFYRVLADSPNLAYVEEIKGFRQSKKPMVNLYEVMKRLDVTDIYKLMYELKEFDVCLFIYRMWLSDDSKGWVASYEGYD